MLSSKPSGFIDIVCWLEPWVHFRGLMVAVKLTCSPTWMFVQPFGFLCGHGEEIFTSTSEEEFADMVTESTIF